MSKQENCGVKGCPNEGRYWRNCGHGIGSVKKPEKIKKESKKKAVINRKEYAPKAKAFREANPECKINSPVCIRETQCVHHMRGKDSIEDLLDDEFWMPSCFPCNTWVEQNDGIARAKGFKLSKHSPKQQNNKAA